MFGGFEPLKNGAPWYYKDLSGIQNADYVVVPKCAYGARVRDLIVLELNAANLPMELVRETDLMILLRLNRS